MLDRLTPREKDVLSYIIQFKTVNGYSPNLREIAKGVNTNSFSHVQDMLEDLKDKGYISYKERQSRTINVLKFPISK